MLDCDEEKWIVGDRTMISTGLVSVTFRKLPVPQIVELVVKAGLAGIEWGGDVHVPHGDLARARETRRLTVESGLRVLSYGSYYRVGHGDQVPFGSVLETAVELEAPTVRVWAGRLGSVDADAEYRNRAVADSLRICDLAQAAGIQIAYEYHGGTLTDTHSSATALLMDVGHQNLGTYWQVSAATVEANLESLNAVLGWLRNVHVPHLRRDQQNTLEAGSANWNRYLDRITRTGRDHAVMIEFVRDDLPQAFLTDAEILMRLVRQSAI